MADLPPNATDTQIVEWLKENRPDIVPFLANEEMKAVAFYAATRDLSDAAFDALIKGTDYWRTHAAPSRAFDALLARPGQADAIALIDQAKGILSDLFARNGITPDDDTLGELAKAAIRSGDITLQGQILDQDGLNSLVAFGMGQSLGDLAPGETSFNADQFRALASSEYLLPITRREADEWAVRVLNGQASEETFRSEMSRRASERYPWLAQHIAAGSTPRSATDGVTAVIADTLGMDPDAVNLMDPKYKGVLEFFDPDAKQYRGMTLGEAAQWARKQDEFKETSQYRQGDAAFTKGLIDFVEGRR